mgnify:CR=1 FL=1
MPFGLIILLPRPCSFFQSVQEFGKEVNGGNPGAGTLCEGERRCAGPAADIGDLQCFVGAQACELQGEQGVFIAAWSHSGGGLQ